MKLYNKIKKVKENKCDKEVYEYLKEKLKNLKIDITSKYKNSNILDLMNKGALEGWCFQTSESAILLFNDDDYIQRGYLKSDDNLDYYHSWIAFNYEDKKYIFDPCLQLISEYEIYHNVFQTKILANIKSKEVKKYIINYIKNHSKKEINEDTPGSNLLKFLKKDLLTEEKERLDKETIIHGREDVNAPIYRNDCGYILNEENGKILSLNVHYYINA